MLPMNIKKTKILKVVMVGLEEADNKKLRINAKRAELRKRSACYFCILHSQFRLSRVKREICHSDEQRGAEGLNVGSLRKCDVKTFGSLCSE